MELLMRCVQCFTKEKNNFAADAVCAERIDCEQVNIAYR